MAIRLSPPSETLKIELRTGFPPVRSSYFSEPPKWPRGRHSVRDRPCPSVPRSDKTIPKTHLAGLSTAGAHCEKKQAVLPEDWTGWRKFLPSRPSSISRFSGPSPFSPVHRQDLSICSVFSIFDAIFSTTFCIRFGLLGRGNPSRWRRIARCTYPFSGALP